MAMLLSVIKLHIGTTPVVASFLARAKTSNLKPKCHSCRNHYILNSKTINWRQIWRVAGRESGSPELSGKSLDFPRSYSNFPRNFPGDFPGSFLTVELNSNPEVPRNFPKLLQKFPELPRRFLDFPGGHPFVWEV